jgi:hypothetical protein
MAVHGDGVYVYDTSEPWGCTNRRHDCNCEKAGGSVATTYLIFATRQMLKRIATIVTQRHLARQVDAQSAGEGERCQDEKQSGSLGGIAARPSEAADHPEVVDIHFSRERSHEHTAGDRVQPEIRVVVPRHDDPETREGPREGL